MLVWIICDCIKRYMAIVVDVYIFGMFENEGWKSYLHASKFKLDIVSKFP